MYSAVYSKFNLKVEICSAFKIVASHPMFCSLSLITIASLFIITVIVAELVFVTLLTTITVCALCSDYLLYIVYSGSHIIRKSVSELLLKRRI